jgi:hypothetical protein
VNTTHNVLALLGPVAMVTPALFKLVILAVTDIEDLIVTFVWTGLLVCAFFLVGAFTFMRHR